MQQQLDTYIASHELVHLNECAEKERVDESLSAFTTILQRFNSDYDETNFFTKFIEYEELSTDDEDDGRGRNSKERKMRHLIAEARRLQESSPTRRIDPATGRQPRITVKEREARNTAKEELRRKQEALAEKIDPVTGISRGWDDNPLGRFYIPRKISRNTAIPPQMGSLHRPKFPLDGVLDDEEEDVGVLLFGHRALHEHLYGPNSFTAALAQETETSVENPEDMLHDDGYGKTTQGEDQDDVNLSQHHKGKRPHQRVETKKSSTATSVGGVRVMTTGGTKSQGRTDGRHLVNPLATAHAHIHEGSHLTCDASVLEHHELDIAKKTTNFDVGDLGYGAMHHSEELGGTVLSPDAQGGAAGSGSGRAVHDEHDPRHHVKKRLSILHQQSAQGFGGAVTGLTGTGKQFSSGAVQNYFRNFSAMNQGLGMVVTPGMADLDDSHEHLSFTSGAIAGQRASGDAHPAGVVFAGERSREHLRASAAAANAELAAKIAARRARRAEEALEAATLKSPKGAKSAGGGEPEGSPSVFGRLFGQSPAKDGQPSASPRTGDGQKDATGKDIAAAQKDGDLFHSSKEVSAAPKTMFGALFGSPTVQEDDSTPLDEDEPEIVDLENTVRRPMYKLEDLAQTGARVRSCSV